MTKKKQFRPKIGDVIELPTSKGLAYVQLCLRHWNWGPLYRVLPGRFEQRPVAFGELVKQKELYFQFALLQRGYHEGRVQIVAHEPVPEHAQSLPLFKTTNGNPFLGPVSHWYLWRDEYLGEYDPLPEEYWDLSVKCLVDDVALVIRIERGWLPRHDVTGETAETLQKEQALRNEQQD